MKIGKLSALTGVNIPTIRYYISLGLLNPEQDSYQYNFTEEDCEQLKRIIKLKSWGLQLKEIHRIQSMLRFSTGVELQEQVDYVSTLVKQREKLEAESGRIQTLIEEINEEIEANKNFDYERENRGVPIQALSILCCPCCQNTLEFSDAQMNSRYINSGKLSCRCGYTARIENGIFYSTLGQNSKYDKADLNRLVYRACPGELSKLIQKSYSWMSSKIQRTVPAEKNIMETNINSFFYLYNNLKDLSPGNLYIVQDKFPEIVELYKHYIEKMNLNLNILYITSSELKLPIRSGSVDLLIDYNSTNEHGIFFHDFYLKTMRQYLKPKAHVIGTYFSFDPKSQSIKNLVAQYPENHPLNYTQSYFLENVKGVYCTVEKKQIGMSLDSGEGLTFIFHQAGEKLYIDSFDLENGPNGR